MAKLRWLLAVMVFGAGLSVGMLVAGAGGPMIKFHDPVVTQGYVTMSVPNPACRTHKGTTRCEWALFVDEVPSGKPVGMVFGVSGTLSVPYPPGYCGILQADAYVGPPYRIDFGHRQVINTCDCP